MSHYETERITKDGRRLPMSISVSPIRNRAGEIVGASTNTRDITETEAGRGGNGTDSDSGCQLALDAAHLGWWHYDPVTKIASYDQRYKEIFGVTGNQRPNEEGSSPVCIRTICQVCGRKWRQRSTR